MKMDLTETKFLELCKSITDYKSYRIMG
jgi:hypothetical protein